MRKLYLLIIVLSFLLDNNKLSAQCSVSISTNPNTTQLNCTNTSITLTANATGAGPKTYLWSTGAATSSISVAAAGLYSVTVKDSVGCTTSSSVSITKDITAPTVTSLAFPDTICRGGSSTLVGIGAVTYLWQPGSLTGAVVSVSPASTITYTVTGTASNGCTKTSAITLVVHPLPTASISGNTTVCQNAAQPLITFTGLSGTKPFTFAYNINGGPTQTITTTGTNTIVTVGAPTGTLGTLNYNLLSVNDLNGCPQTQTGTAAITVLPASVLTSPKTASICDNTPFRYTATSSAAGTTFNWTRAAVAGINNLAGSGTTAIINETLDNITFQPVVVKYIFTLSTGTGCVTTDSLMVTVNPTPVIDPITNKSYCNGDFLSGGIGFTSSSPGASFSWTNSNTNIGLPASGSGSIPAFIATNTGGSSITGTITVFIKASADSCAGANRTFTITVLPAPVLTSPKAASICDNTPFRYTATSSAAGTSFNWTRAFVAGINNPASSGTTVTINETLDNTTSQPVTVKYIFTLSTGTGCVTTDSVKVTVNPTPVIDPITNKSYCNGEFVNGGIAFTSSSPDASFTWTNSNTNIGLPVSGGGSIPGFIATNNSGTSITATINVSVKASADSCAGTSRSFTITVLPAPILTSPKTASICDNAPFSYTATSSAAGTSFNWTRAFVAGINNLASSGTTVTINETFDNITSQPVAVIYIFTLSTGTGCVTTDSVKVTVNPTPAIDPIANKSYCNGEFVNGGIAFTSSSPDASFSWTNSNTNIGLPASGSGSIPAFIAVNTSDSSIEATISVFIKASADSCAGTNTTFTITVLPAPFLKSIKDISICDNAPLTYTATSSAAGTAFSWTRAFVAGISNPATSGTTATINETFDNTTSQPAAVKYIFTLSTGTGCVTTDSVKVTVNPTPVIDPITDKSYCNGEFVSGGIPFTSSSPGTSFSWTNSDTSIGLPAGGSGSIPAFIATNTGGSSIAATITVFIKASADSCAGTSTTFTIIVLPAPVLTSSKTASVCNSATFGYTATSSATGTNFSWFRTADSFNIAGSGSTNIINETLHNASPQPMVVKYIFSLTTGTGCVTIDSVQVTVNPTPVIDSITNKLYCNDDFVSGGILFTSGSPGASFTWTNSDTSIGLPANGSGDILPFNAKDTTNKIITATITVSIKASSDSCAGANKIFTITVLPSPVLTSPRTVSICDSTLFSYMATSSADSTNFRWTRAFVAGINNPASSDTTTTINETLDNTSSQPVDIYYVFTLSTGFNCVTKDSVKVTVNPTPVINPVSDTAFCNNYLVQPIDFSSSTNNASLTWTSDQSIGFGKVGGDGIPAFITNNQSDSSVNAQVKVAISVGNKCQGDTVAFTITVYPTPVLTSTKTISICDSAAFTYNATSSAIGTRFSWTRPAVAGINNSAASGTTAAINETLDNTTSQPIVVRYIFTLTTGTSCSASDTLKVTVNPTPVINPISNYTFCNGDHVSGISFGSSSPKASFKWTSNITIGFGSSGSDSIPAFIATNTGINPVVDTVTVSITASTDQCPGSDSIFTITVNPSPQNPHFTSLSRYPDSVTLTLCSGSENINFNVNPPANGISYKWTSTANPSTLSIRDANDPNTVISFNNPGTYTINAIATNATRGCADTVSQIVQVDNTKGIDERKIFLMQPGNLLIYPDNSLNGYQWGYDSIMAPDSSFGLPTPLQGQVYQFFIPGAKFITSTNLLDTTRYLYWVLLQNGNCYTRVYYNGPYANRPVQANPSDNTVQLQVIPNPNKGMFEIALKGNIYGKMDAKIYNSMGHVVFSKNFVKMIPAINEIFNTNNLPGGLYFLVLRSSDLKQVVSRFVIQH